MAAAAKSASARTPRDRTSVRVNAATAVVSSVSSVAVDPIDTRTVYVGTDHGVFRSTDRGATWLERDLIVR